MTLGEKQRDFVRDVGRLIEWAYANGYELTFAEAYRTPEQAVRNAQTGAGIANSLHTQRLAVDLNLFKSGEYQTDSADYAPLGAQWKSLNTENAWGGDFSKPDGNHFSRSHNGVK